MKVSILCSNDWANVAYELQQCLLRVGLEAKAIKSNKHHYNYKNQAVLFKHFPGWRKWVEDSQVVIFMHSEFIKTGVSLVKKKVYVKHTGSKYRQNSQKINQIFNPIVTATLPGGDVLGMGAKNEVWIQPPIDVYSIKPIYRTDFSKKLIFGHYPSSDKGTEAIVKTINEIQNEKFIFKYSQTNVPWVKQLQRMGECDIYIGSMKHVQGKVPMKIFGITTLESACLGKININIFPMKPQYEKNFGKCPIISPNNPNELKTELLKILTMSNEDILKLQKETRAWVERCHSYEVIGNQYLKLFNRTK